MKKNFYDFKRMPLSFVGIQNATMQTEQIKISKNLKINALFNLKFIIMKKIIICLLGTVLFGFSAQAETITVSNNPYTPGQYTNLQEAIDASSSGDTILVAGSATSYGSVTIKLPLTILGAGYNNPNGENSIVGTISLRRENASIGADNVKIAGFITSTIALYPNFSGGNLENQILNNIIVERCYITGNQIIPYTSSTQITNLIMRNNIFKNSGIYLNNSYSSNSFVHAKFSNNIFENTIFYYGSSGNGGSGVELTNNVFLNTSSQIFSGGSNQLNGLMVSNNVFYGVRPEGCINCVFNNNLTYLCTNDNLLSGTNPGSIGSGNIVGQDPEFENYQGGTFNYTHDFHLKDTSLAKNAGVDGTDLGVYGGVFILDELVVNPAIPQMTELDFPSGSSVPSGGSLQIHFKAQKQD